MHDQVLIRTTAQTELPYLLKIKAPQSIDVAAQRVPPFSDTYQAGSAVHPSKLLEADRVVPNLRHVSRINERFSRLF